MDDIASKITELLNDPKGMENLKSMAQSILSENNINLPQEKKQEDGLDMTQISSIMNIMNKFNSAQKDDRTSLLMALRPHLTSARQERLDRAVKIIKIYSMLPLIQQSGLFDF